MIRTFIFDADGTLSDPTHRRHWIQGKSKNWRAFTEGCRHDPPLPTLRIFEQMYNSWDDVFIFSGRDNSARELTLDWLLEHTGIKTYQRAHLSSILYMRPAGDYRPDEIVKKEFLDQVKAQYEANKEEYKIMGVFDDRNKVIRMWKEQGLFVFDVNQSGEEF